MRRRTVKACQCCGAEFWAGQPWARWCSSLCRKRAYERRRRGVPEADWAANAPSLIPSHVHQPNLVEDNPPTAWSLPLAGTEERFWHGTAIQRRRSDGFVNATAMCQANGRRWAKYAESERAKQYMQALAAVVPNSDFGIVQTQRGGSLGGGATWVHPSLAIDLARWISPAFAVWMDGWFLESLARPAQAPLSRGIHVVAKDRRDSELLWSAMLRKELMASLSLLDQIQFGTNAALAPAPIQMHFFAS